MKMTLEVVSGPEAANVKGDQEWFPITDGGRELILGDNAYAKIVAGPGTITTKKAEKKQ